MIRYSSPNTVLKQEDKTMKKMPFYKQTLSVLVIMALSGSLYACTSVIEATGDNMTDPTTSTDIKSDTSSENIVIGSEKETEPSYDTNDAVQIELTGDSASCSSSSVKIAGSTVTIGSAGTYVISGTLTDGQIVVDAGKEDEIQIILAGCDITSSDSAAIYVAGADNVFVTLEEGTLNSLANGGTFSTNADDKINGVIFSKDDLTLSGEGNLTIISPDANGIVCKDDLVISGGTYQIDCAKNAVKANDSITVSDGNITVTGCNDGLHAENDDDDTLGYIVIQGGNLDITAVDDGIHGTSLVTIDDGNINVTAAEGIEGTCITINGGTINISASDDGINAAQKSDSYTPYVEINGGEITIVMGQGDTDGIDSNGNLIITGGTIDITGQSPFDYDLTCEYSGGTLIVNGTQTNEITNQFGGGGPGMGGRPGMDGDSGFGGPGMGW